jgi:hypothetical protein
MKATFIGFGCLLIAAATTDLIACTCQTRPLENRLKATVIFVGEAVQSRTIYKDTAVDATFEVAESFTANPTVGQIVGARNGACGGISYEQGKRYLIYGFRLPRVPNGEIFEIGWCSGTRELDETHEELTYVRDWTRTHPYSQNRLSGTLVDSAGKPISYAPVDLVASEEPELRRGRFDEITDETGHFEFIKVLPGEYVLGINIRNGPFSFRPYPALYFPGVQTRRDAAIIRLYGSEQLDGFEFVLPDRLPTREVSARILWWDGTPVVNAQIRCRIGVDSYNRETLIESTGQQGSAKFEILATDHFEIAVMHPLWRSPTALQSPPETVLDVPIIRGEPGVTTQEVSFVIPRSHDQRGLLTSLTN